MGATVECHAGTLRIGSLHAKYIDDYEWSCTITFERGGTVAMLHGANRRPKPSIWRAGRECLRGLGVKIVRFERVRNGKVTRKREYRL